VVVLRFESAIRHGWTK